MRNFMLITIFLAAALPARAQTQAWVQAVAAGGYEARVITGDETCPTLKSDKGDVAMTVRAPANGAFPLTCGAPLPAGAEPGFRRRSCPAAARRHARSHPGAGRHRVPHQGRCAAGLQRSRGLAFSIGRGGGRKPQARSGGPCRRLSVSRGALPARQCRLRRLAVRRQLAKLAGGFFCSGSAAACRRTLGDPARQSRGLPTRRSGFSAPAGTGCASIPARLAIGIWRRSSFRWAA